MEHIRAERDGELLVVTLARGKANALNAAMLDEIYSAVGDAASDSAVRGLVLTSANPRFFSPGFDVREVFAYSREQMSAFFTRFTELYESLRALPKPAVAALTGHTFAGGSILAIACDVRIMARGDFGFALNEINLGLVLTPEIGRMLIEAVGPGHARELLLTGEPVTPQRAYEIGLVNELAEPDQVLERALAYAHLLAAKPPLTFAAMKQQIRALAAGAAPAAGVEQFVELWFSAEAAEARRGVVEKLVR